MYSYLEHTSFYTLSNGSKHLTDDDLMRLKSQTRKKDLIFAVESYAFDESFREDTEFCVQNSAEHLRVLIESCRGRIVLRDLTEQEKKQMKEFKKEKKSKSF